MQVRHLGLLDRVTVSLRVAGWDVDAEDDDEVFLREPGVAGETGVSADGSSSFRPAQDDLFDKRALIVPSAPELV